MFYFKLSLAVSLAVVVSGFIPQVTVCLKHTQLTANLTKEGWLCPDKSAPMYSNCSIYSAKFHPAQNKRCSDYEFTAEVNTGDHVVDAYPTYEDSLHLCVIDFPLPEEKNASIILNLVAKDKTLSTPVPVFCSCEPINPHYIDASPQLMNITATVSCDIVNITWTTYILVGYKINGYTVTISEMNITLKVTDPYVVFNLTTSDKLGVLRPNSFYNVTVELSYCGGAEIGDSSSTIISTNMNSIVSENLTYNFQNFSDSKAYLQFQPVVQEVCVLLSLSVKFDCERHTAINDTYEVHVTSEHTVLVNITLPIGKTCTGTLQWMNKDIALLIQHITLKTFYLLISNDVGSVSTVTICCSVHIGEHQNVTHQSVCDSDNPTNPTHSTSSIALSHILECNNAFYPGYYSIEYSRYIPEPSKSTTWTPSFTTTIPHSFSSSSSTTMTPTCTPTAESCGIISCSDLLLYVVPSVFAVLLLIIMILTVVLICKCRTSNVALYKPNAGRSSEPRLNARRPTEEEEQPLNKTNSSINTDEQPGTPVTNLLHGYEVIAEPPKVV